MKHHTHSEGEPTTPVHTPAILSESVGLETREIKELLTQVIAMNERIAAQNNRINRRITWMVVSGYVRLLLITLPFVAAAFFLPPLIRQMVSQYQAVLGNDSSTPITASDTGGVSAGVREMMQQFEK